MTNDADIIALLQTSPVAVTVSSKNWASYSSGIYSCPSNSIIDHAVELVGYTSTYWILKNQWGSSWGQNGFIWVTRSRAQNTTNCFIGSAIVQYSLLSKSNWKSSLIYLELIVLVVFLMV
jgi:C1A family cysteine protease